ncbi:aldo/keto reductase [Desertifilum tharense IPPAS B-1220]|uniref:Aldo/keto reductase n=1 Tax=Desertifilum tharense IPPAS B-1220 TaxID=1781255 RepID=A0A1E5QDH5_9CYAN|nr:aldo/keto reductase [Desertifilum tharense IPPAS B-1220]
MQYRRFGRTELSMPVFSCGGMRYQYKRQDTPRWRIPRDSQQNLEKTIARSLSVGINHIETARGYGTSEIQLGSILPKHQRDRLIVQTKVGPNADPKEFRRNLEKSLANLRLDSIDLLGIHGINTLENLHHTIRPGGCLDIARQLQNQGKIRFIGFSTHGPTDIIIQAIETDQFDYVNLHWYYINQTNWPAIEAAKRHDMGVFIISPSDKGGMLYNPPQRLVELCDPLSPMVFNDLFCLSQPQVHTLSIGAARPTDFDEHLKVLPLLDRADEILPPIVARLAQAACDRLGEDWMKTWDIGLPQHHETPGNVNIPVILGLRNLALAYDLVDFAKSRYNLLGNGGHWFPGQKADCIDELNLRSCLANSPHADIIPSLLKETHELLGDREIKRISQS